MKDTVTTSRSTNKSRIGSAESTTLEWKPSLSQIHEIIDVKKAHEKPVLADGKSYTRVGKATRQMGKDEYEIWLRTITAKDRQHFRFHFYLDFLFLYFCLLFILQLAHYSIKIPSIIFSIYSGIVLFNLALSQKFSSKKPAKTFPNAPDSADR